MSTDQSDELPRQREPASDPLPRQFFRIWKSRRSGSLAVDADTRARRIGFCRGNLCLQAMDLDLESLIPELVESGMLSRGDGDLCRGAVERGETGLLPSLHEIGGIPPDSLWRFLDIRFRENLYPLFDLEKGALSFQTEPVPDGSEILFSVPTPVFILEGIRRMNNLHPIETWMPPENVVVQTQTPEYAGILPLNPAEVYLFQLLDQSLPLGRVLEISLLGPRETKRGLYLFHCLELSITDEKNQPGERGRDFSHAELHRLLDEFNRRCAAVYKYLAKEIGPAAPNMIEKCVDETREHLSPFFRNLRLDHEGRMDPSAILKSGPSLSGKNTRQALVSDINEILAAEIFAVKKFLGDEHEAALIRLMERMEG